MPLDAEERCRYKGEILAEKKGQRISLTGFSLSLLNSYKAEVIAIVDCSLLLTIVWLTSTNPLNLFRSLSCQDIFQNRHLFKFAKFSTD